MLFDRRTLCASIVALVAAPINRARAAWTPSRPIEILVSFPAGGGADTIARGLADRLRSVRGWQGVVVNRPGGNGTIFFQGLQQAKADGHAIGICISPQLVFTPEGASQPPFKVDDFLPIAAIANNSSTVLVRADSPLNSVTQIKELAATRGSLSVGISSARWIGEAIQKSLGVEVVTVPYKGGAELVTALLGGHIDMCVVASSVSELEQAGKIRVLASLSEKRMTSRPDLPTFLENGIQAIYEYSFIVLAPKALDSGIAAELAAAIAQSCEDEQLRAKVKTVVGEPVNFLSGNEFVERLRQEERTARAQEALMK